MQPQIFIFDTGVLYRYLAGKAGFDTKQSDSKVFESVKTLLERGRVVIPHTVLVEILGQFFHQQLCNLTPQTLGQHNYRAYTDWYRARQRAFNPIMQAILDPNLKVELYRREPPLESVGFIYDAINENLHRDLMDFYRKRKDKQLRAREPKCLDGMDGQIILDAVSIAKENRKSRCTFITQDVVLQAVIKDVRRRACVAGSGLPSNLFCHSSWRIRELLNNLG